MAWISQVTPTGSSSNCMFDLASRTGGTRILTHIRLLENSPSPVQSGEIKAFQRRDWILTCVHQTVGTGMPVNPLIVVQRSYSTKSSKVLIFDPATQEIDPMEYVPPPLAAPTHQVGQTTISLYGTNHPLHVDGQVRWASGDPAHPDALGSIFPLNGHPSTVPSDYGVLIAEAPGEAFYWGKLSRLIEGLGGCL